VLSGQPALTARGGLAFFSRAATPRMLASNITRYRNRTTPSSHHVQADVTAVGRSALVRDLTSITLRSLYTQDWDYSCAATILAANSKTSKHLANPTLCTGKSHGVSLPGRNSVNEDDFAQSILSSIPWQQPSSAMVCQWSKQSTDGTTRCHASRRCCQRTNTQSTIARKRNTARESIVS
jgi:hypothetical protein